MPALPNLVAWTLSALGTVLMIKLVGREWQRVNAELDRAHPLRVRDPERSRLPTLQRDPRTGVYKPDR
jgi:hypothetical protein